MVLLLDCHLRALDGEEEGEGEGEGHEHEGEEDDHLVEHLPRVPACVLQPAPRPVLYPGHGGPPPGPAPAILLQLEVFVISSSPSLSSPTNCCSARISETRYCIILYIYI